LVDFLLQSINFTLFMNGRTLKHQWVLIAHSTKVFSSSFYSSLPMARSIFLEEKIDDAQTQTLSPLGM
jgi:hypothetical protein